MENTYEKACFKKNRIMRRSGNGRTYVIKLKEGFTTFHYWDDECSNNDSKIKQLICVRV